MNLTDDQIDLLRKLVVVHQSGKESEFILVTSHGGNTLVCGELAGIPSRWDESDFQQLADERLITLRLNSAKNLCGKLTKFGIEAATADPATLGHQTAGEQAKSLVYRSGVGDSTTERPLHPGISGSTAVRRFQLLGEIERPGAPNMANRPFAKAEDRRRIVSDFVRTCAQETSVKMHQKYIWLAAGHKTARQFQYWQARDIKATQADNDNFARILNMNPPEFVALLRKKGII